MTASNATCEPTLFDVLPAAHEEVAVAPSLGKSQVYLRHLVKRRHLSARYGEIERANDIVQLFTGTDGKNWRSDGRSACDPIDGHLPRVEDIKIRAARSDRKSDESRSRVSVKAGDRAL